jgi:hypothetical protein
MNMDLEEGKGNGAVHPVAVERENRQSRRAGITETSTGTQS